jgi:drug/metabolite transporter (DMT)-like permease
VLFVVVGSVAAGVVGFAASRMTSDRRRGALLGIAAGTLFGLVAGLLKLVTVEARSGLAQAFAHWSLWALLVIGLAAVLLNQLAYQSTRLSVTAPLLNIAQVLVALAFGAAVFGERFDGSPLAMAAELGGLLLLGAGIWKLAAQPADQKELVGEGQH